MKNLIYCAFTYWIIILFGIIIGIFVFITERHSKFTKDYLIFLPIACIVLICFTIPHMKDLAQKEILCMEVKITSSANHAGLLKDYITIDEDGNKYEFRISRFLYEHFAIEEGKRYKIFYYKNSKCIEHVELIE